MFAENLFYFNALYLHERIFFILWTSKEWIYFAEDSDTKTYYEKFEGKTFIFLLTSVHDVTLSAPIHSSDPSDLNIWKKFNYNFVL